MKINFPHFLKNPVFNIFTPASYLFWFTATTILKQHLYRNRFTVRHRRNPRSVIRCFIKIIKSCHTKISRNFKSFLLCLMAEPHRNILICADKGIRQQMFFLKMYECTDTALHFIAFIPDSVIFKRNSISLQDIFISLPTQKIFLAVCRSSHIV